MRYRGAVDLLTGTIDINASTTHSVTANEQKALDVAGVTEVTFSVKVTGADASASGDVDFNFIGYNGTDWDTVAFATVTVTINGTTAAIKSLDKTIGSREQIKLLNIQNKDASYGVTVNYVKAMLKA